MAGGATTRPPSTRSPARLTLFKTGAAPELADGLAQKVAGLRGLRQAFVELIRAGQQRGELRADLDPDAAATPILSLLNGVALTWLLDQAAFSPATQAPLIAEICMRGMV